MALQVAIAGLVQVSIILEQTVMLECIAKQMRHHCHCGWAHVAVLATFLLLSVLMLLPSPCAAPLRASDVTAHFGTHCK